MKGIFQTSKRMRIKVDPPAGKTITTFVVTEINGQKTSVHTRHDGLRVCVVVDPLAGRPPPCSLLARYRPRRYVHWTCSFYPLLPFRLKIPSNNHDIQPDTGGKKNKQTQKKAALEKSWLRVEWTKRKPREKEILSQRKNCVILSTPKFRPFPFLVFSFIWDSHETCQ